MNDIFKLNGPLFTLLNRIANLAILNVLFILACLPIFTIGAAITALFSVIYRSNKDDHLAIAKEFFKAFRENFKQSSLLWGIHLGMILPYVGVTAYVIRSFPVFTLPMAIIGSVLALYFIVPYALQSQFKNSMKETMKNALLIVFRFLPYVMMMFLVGLVLLVILPVFYRQTFYFVTLFGFSVTAQLQLIFFKKIVTQLEQLKEG